jgi:hypothetical protein
MRVLHEAVEFEKGGERNPEKQIRHTMQAARAIVETANAEMDLSAIIIEESQSYLQAAHDIADAVDERLSVAQDNLGGLMEAGQWRGLYVTAPTSTPSTFDTQPRSRSGLRTRRISRSHRSDTSSSDSERERGIKPDVPVDPVE